MSVRVKKTDFYVHIFVNLLVLLVVLYAFALNAYSPELFYLSGQEDEYVEWATFWSFLFAAILAFRGALLERRENGRLPWFLLGVSLFCLFVAMEEVSWGQRILGYQPPVYFLEHNAQQEFNFHNTIEDNYREYALLLVICLYGLVLPLLGCGRQTSRWMEKIGIVPASVALAPIFLATLGLYLWNPWKFCAEWVEFMLGLGFLFSAFYRPPNIRSLNGNRVQNNKQDKGAVRRVIVATVSWGLILGLGYVSAEMSRKQRAMHPGNLTAARVELNALKEDFSSGLVATMCNVHMRVFMYYNRYEASYLRVGSYDSLQIQGLPGERAGYFIDPWHMSYWLEGKCPDGETQGYLFLYSFGPNRIRDSFSGEIAGDDIGVKLR